jgi:hypothetical protein
MSCFQLTWWKASITCRGGMGVSLTPDEGWVSCQMGMSLTPDGDESHTRWGWVSHQMRDESHAKWGWVSHQMGMSLTPDEGWVSHQMRDESHTRWGGVSRQQWTTFYVSGLNMEQTKQRAVIHRGKAMQEALFFSLPLLLFLLLYWGWNSRLQTY